MGEAGMAERGNDLGGRAGGQRERQDNCFSPLFVAIMWCHARSGPRRS